jgi:hypothetical protein
VTPTPDSRRPADTLALHANQRVTDRTVTSPFSDLDAWNLHRGLASLPAFLILHAASHCCVDRELRNGARGRNNPPHEAQARTKS